MGSQFLDLVLHLCPMHFKGESSPLDHQGSLKLTIHISWLMDTLETVPLTKGFEIILGPEIAMLPWMMKKCSKGNGCT